MEYDDPLYWLEVSVQPVNCTVAPSFLWGKLSHQRWTILNKSDQIKGIFNFSRSKIILVETNPMLFIVWIFWIGHLHEGRSSMACRCTYAGAPSRIQLHLLPPAWKAKKSPPAPAQMQIFAGVHLPYMYPRTHAACNCRCTYRCSCNCVPAWPSRCTYARLRL